MRSPGATFFADCRWYSLKPVTFPTVFSLLGCSYVRRSRAGSCRSLGNGSRRLLGAILEHAAVFAREDFDELLGSVRPIRKQALGEGAFGLGDVLFEQALDEVEVG